MASSRQDSRSRTRAAARSPKVASAGCGVAARRTEPRTLANIVRQNLVANLCVVRQHSSRPRQSAAVSPHQQTEEPCMARSPSRITLVIAAVALVAAVGAVIGCSKQASLVTGPQQSAVPFLATTASKAEFQAAK